MQEIQVSNNMPKTNITESVTSRDARNDLGYGRTSNKFHKPRSLGGAYPYQEKSDFDVETEWDDEDTEQAISSKILKHQKSDPFSKKGTNPFYFAAGSTKLADCFYRTEDVLKEIAHMANSLVPIPGLYKKRTNFSPGTKSSAGSISNKNFKRTGSKKGFASAPPEIKYDKNVNDEDEVIFNLEDLVKKLEIETGNFRL
jgi:hypothetical protein